MIILGLTGSIAMGKSTIAKMLKISMHIPVWNADQCVHDLYRNDKIVFDAVHRHFPKCIIDDKIDRKLLGEIVFEDAKSLDLLETILYPHIEKKCQVFIHKCRLFNQPYCILDIPLLFEKEWNKWCDAVIVTYAKPAIQHNRLKKRLGGRYAQIDAIIERQINDNQKLARADFVVETSLSKNYTLKELTNILSLLQKRKRQHRCVKLF